MRYLSLFSGIEAATVAWHPLGWQCAAVAEIEPFPCALLAHHYPDVPNLGDVTQITEDQIAALGHLDVIVFGSPCQDLSVAGKRAGLEGARSGLFHDAIRIVSYARQHNGLRYALWENVPGAFSSNKGADFAVVVSELAGLPVLDVPPRGWGTEGIALGEKALVEWSVLDAQWFGVAQRRRRVFALADFGNWRGRPPILLESESLRGDFAPRRETGQSITGPIAGCSNGGGAKGPGRTADDADSLVVGTLEARSKGGGFPGTDGAAAGHVVRCGRSDIAGTVSSKWAKGTGGPAGPAGDEHYNLTVTHSLRAAGFDASEDGTGRGTPLVVGAICKESFSGGAGGRPEGAAAGHFLAFDARQDCLHGPVPGPLSSSSPQSQAVAIRTANTGANGHGVAEGVAHTLDQAQGQAVAFESRFARNGRGAPSDVVPPLKAQSGETGKGDAAPLLLHAMQVRRLTPRECERLQGFPDDYTLIPYRNKPAADGPRYKALGNSMAVPVMRWIGEQIDIAELF